MAHWMAYPRNQKTKKPLKIKGFVVFCGGKGEIRTHGTPKRTPDFESGAFDHSATFPLEARKYIEAFWNIKFFMRALLHALR